MNKYKKILSRGNWEIWEGSGWLFWVQTWKYFAFYGAPINGEGSLRQCCGSRDFIIPRASKSKEMHSTDFEFKAFVKWYNER